MVQILFYFLNLFYIGVQLLYNIVLVSGVSKVIQLFIYIQPFFSHIGYLINFFIIIYISWLFWVFVAAQAFSAVAAGGGWSLVAVPSLLIAVASPVAERGLQGAPASAVVAPGLDSSDPWAQLLHSIWDLPRSGIESVSPALANRFFTTEPPGKPSHLGYYKLFSRIPLAVYLGSPVAQLVQNLPAMWEIWVRSLSQEGLLEKGKASHSSIFAILYIVVCIC